ncbi:MAG: SDR family NAD(P)-dependent oxidoreductase, partial [Nocardioides sp.]
MAARFEGRTAIVTGASRGIGFGIAQRLVADGARVVITARKQDTLDEAVAALGGPEHALGIAGRVDDTDHQAEIVARAIETFGSADLLVNNAGINPVAGGLLRMDLESARKTIDVNCFAGVTLVQQVRRAWMKEHGGAIVNVSSVAGLG